PAAGQRGTPSKSMAQSPLEGGPPSRGLGLHAGRGRLSIKGNVGKSPKVAARPRPPHSRYLRGQERELGPEPPPSRPDAARVFVLSGQAFPTSGCTVGLCPVIFQVSALSTPTGTRLLACKCHVICRRDKS
uniref:Uncharacterized protein n=1 Tax=Phocoena sinus TaxID=42100 RepID=A0A8C9E5M0_PHOSS